MVLAGGASSELFTFFVFFSIVQNLNCALTKDREMLECSILVYKNNPEDLMKKKKKYDSRNKYMIENNLSFVIRKVMEQLNKATTKYLNVSL